MSFSLVRTFEDPDQFQAAFRAGNYEMLAVNSQFRAELIRVDFARLGMQRSNKSGPSVVLSATDARRVSMMFLSDPEQEAPRRNGMELSAHEIVVNRPGSTNHLQAQGASRLSMMGLEADDLAAEALAVTGRELSTPRHTYIAPAAPALLARLRTLHAAACRLAKTDPDALNQPATFKALEQQLVHAMVTCLIDHPSYEAGRSGGPHARIILRFEDFLVTRQFEPVYLAEICKTIGASERTLRSCCQEHFGMGPIRYLWLRRMNLARRALLDADPALNTVTEIATRHGFWELGQFSVDYRKLFSESPSASLRRPAADREYLRLGAVASDFT